MKFILEGLFWLIIGVCIIFALLFGALRIVEEKLGWLGYKVWRFAYDRLSVSGSGDRK